MVKIPFLNRQKTPQVTDEQPEEENLDGHELRMGLFDHLDELRVRLTRAVLSLVVGMVIGIFLAVPALTFLQAPYCQIRYPEACEFQTLGPTGGVVAYFRVVLMLGAIIAVPMVTYQVMMFIVPGLTRKEKRFILLSIPPITVLFLVGVAFSWYILMPPALGFLEGFQPTIFRPEWTADLYLSFVTSLLFWMGVAFETPLVFFVLSLLGFVSAIGLLRQWRMAVVGTAVAAAFITPTIDPVNMFLVMGPLMGLYLISIVLVFFGRRISGVDRA